MRELLAVAKQIGVVAASCSDTGAAELLREAEAMLVEASREQHLEQVDDRGALEELILAACSKPGHAVVLLDLLGQTWVGYSAAVGAYVARPPSRLNVLDAIAVRTNELWLPVAELARERFPMLALYAPPTQAGTSYAVAAGGAR